MGVLQFLFAQPCETKGKLLQEKNWEVKQKKKKKKKEKHEQQASERDYSLSRSLKRIDTIV